MENASGGAEAASLQSRGGGKTVAAGARKRGRQGKPQSQEAGSDEEGGGRGRGGRRASSGHRAKHIHQYDTDEDNPTEEESGCGDGAGDGRLDLTVWILSEWPGQSEGEPIDLPHFWNVVSMMYPEEHSREVRRLYR